MLMSIGVMLIAIGYHWYFEFVGAERYIFLVLIAVGSGIVTEAYRKASEK